MAVDNMLVAFNEADASELLKLIGGGSSGGGFASDADRMQADCLIGVATSTITARAGAVLGTGTVQVKYIDAANTLQDLYTASVVNLGSAIANGSYVKLFRVGNRLSVVEIC